MKIIKKQITSLKPAPYNPRKDIKEDSDFYEKLYKSIKKFGYIEPIIYNKQTNHIVGGNQRYTILKETGIKEIDVIEVDLNEDDEKALNIALNKITGDWDDDKLESLLTELNQHDYLMDITGFNEKELNQLIKTDNNPEENFDLDKAIEQESRYNVKRGDIYQLGNHRLMCGDSCDSDDVKQLVNDNKIDLLITDPPYNVNYSSKNELLNLYDKGNRIQTPLKNHFSTEQEYLKFTKTWINNVLDVLNDYNSLYVFGNYESLIQHYFIQGIIVSNMLVWVKNNKVLGRMDYKGQHEFILYSWKKHHKWYGDHSQSTTLFEDKPLKSEYHPTMKPIKLIIKLIKNSSLPKHNIIDLFGGSGSTLIACEQTQRRCYMMEIDPHYCSVIIERWENLTKKKHKKVAT